ncbi:MAG: PLP-dependent aminotransferase family protein [Firmicutes bacterium]|jgi:DNA-binding transcriptional MocR family regulator|nr:PLP-dependent aminotransferase family protein [Bacillota bacterium]
MKKFQKIQLNKEDKEHLYIQLYKNIESMIHAGELKAGDKLPPIRKIAKGLEVNNSTIVNAYKLLEDKGLVLKKAGSGTYIKGDEYEELPEDGVLNFASGSPHQDIFPVEEFKVLLNKVLDRDGGRAFQYDDTKGYYNLRKAIKESGFQNIAIEKIQIISGAQQGLDIISKSILNPSDTIVVESPTYSGAIELFKSNGCNIVEVALHEDGLDIERLEKVLSKNNVKMFYTNTNFQNPTGYCYSKEKIDKILHLAEKKDFFIIEDDYSSELNYYGKDIYNFLHRDKNDRVLYVKSFSKLFVPGIRLGYMISPDIFIDEILFAKHISDISTSGLIQRTFELYIKEGLWDKRLDLTLENYKERYEKVISILSKNLPKEVSFHEPRGGLHIWIGLPNGYSTDQLYKRLRDKDILIAPGSSFKMNRKPSNYFRLSFSTMSDELMEEGLKVIIEEIIDFISFDLNINSRLTESL